MRQGSIKEDSNGDFRNFFSYFAFSSSILLLFSVFMQSLIFSILEFMRFVKIGIYCNINNIVKYEGFSCISIYSPVYLYILQQHRYNLHRIIIKIFFNIFSTKEIVLKILRSVIYKEIEESILLGF